MKLKRTGSRWDRIQRININDNWDTLEKENTRLSDIGKQAENTLKEAFDINSEAKRVNDENKNVQQQIDNLILADGESDAEVIQARGDKPLLKDRLDALDKRLQQIPVNVKDFGAIGDGKNHPLSERFQYLSQAKEVYPHAYALDNEIDWCAIQAAVNHTINQGGGRVYLPTGRYVTSDTINLDSNIEFAGAGMYNTIFFPTYLGISVFQNLIRVPGNELDRKKDVVLRDFGIDGSNIEYYETSETTHAVGQWARIEVRFTDNFIAHDIYYYSGSHLFQMSNVDGFLIDRIRTDLSFNTVHMTSGNGDSKNGVISNIVATRVNCVVDFGGGGRDVIVSDIYGDNEGFVSNYQELIDIGGAKNIQINNVVGKNFDNGITVKGESGVAWDDISLSNVTLINFKKTGIRVTPGDGTVSGKIKLSNIKLVSNTMETNNSRFALEIITGRVEADISELIIDANAGGFHSYDFEKLKLNNATIKSGERGFFISSSGNGEWDINGLEVDAGDRAIELTGTNERNKLNNFVVTNGIGHAVYYRNVTSPIIQNGIIDGVNSHGIHLSFSEGNIHQKDTLNGLNAEISNVVIRDWGETSTYRNGIMFTLPSVVGTFSGLRIKDVSFEITGTQNTQFGIGWGGFINNHIDNSWVDGVTFYRVPKPQEDITAKGTNIIENVLVIS